MKPLKSELSTALNFELILSSILRIALKSPNRSTYGSVAEDNSARISSQTRFFEARLWGAYMFIIRASLLSIEHEPLTKSQFAVDFEEEKENIFLFQSVRRPPDCPIDGLSIHPKGGAIPREFKFFSDHKAHLVSCRQTSAGLRRRMIFLTKYLLVVLLVPLTFQETKDCKSIRLKGRKKEHQVVITLGFPL